MSEPPRSVGYKNPPVEQQIKPGERRNPNGRRGKGNPKAEAADNEPNLDEIIREEIARLVPQSDGTQIEIIRRIVQEVTLKAARGNLSAIRIALAEARRVYDRERAEDEELLKLFYSYHYEGLAKFAEHKRLGLEPPDIIPHPAHVLVEDGNLRIAGPLNHEDQVWWETLKRIIFVQSQDLAWSRDFLRGNPNDEWAREQLEEAQRKRRQMMRKVPKGWNWREQIWNQASDAQERERARLLRKLDQERAEREHDQVSD